ncbi:MAG: lysylphosphatidylglycerol synthase transmembrane domain-containing protein [Halobacteria archaeon]|nr:lysylphosphatidylglycerol synthase transmembrane domain-containing protein [Halobacteria archaeon]
MRENSLVNIGWRGWVWFGVAGALLAGLLYLADIGKFVDSLRRADMSLFAVAVAIGFSSLLVWAWVWHRFFVDVGVEVTATKTLHMFLTGNFLNSVTPLGQFGGEPIMAYIVSQTTDTDYDTSLACVVSADLLNATPFFTFTLGGILYLGVFGSLRGPFVEIAGLVVVLMTLFGLVAYLLWSDDAKLWNGLNRLIDGIEARFEKFESVFKSVRGNIEGIERAFQEAGSDRRFLMTTAGVSHLAILAQIASLYFVFRSLGLPTEFVPIYLIVNLSVIATLSPTPGGTGTYETAFTGLTTLFYSVDLTTAVTAAVLFRLTTYWPGILVGAGAFLTLKDDV